MSISIPGSASPSAGRWPAFAFLREPAALAGSVMVLAYLLIAVVVDWLALRDPLQLSAFRLAPPSAEFPLGTDALGRDLLSRILFGARLSVEISFASVAIATAAGSALGLASGYLGGAVDFAIGRVVDV